MILSTAKLWGWHNATLNTRRRVWIARAVCQKVAYDHGYEQTMMTHNTITLWDESLQNVVINSGENIANNTVSTSK